MAYYSRFQSPGRFEEEWQSVEQRRQALIKSVQQRQPGNLDELLAAGEGGEAAHELEWVDVPDPRSTAETSGDTINVLPIIRLHDGNKDAEDPNDVHDKGAFGLMIVGELPFGDENLIGEMTFFHKDGALQDEFSLRIAGGRLREVGWESADASLFMTLAQSALDLQP